MSVTQQVEHMSADQFQDWVQTQMTSATSNRIQDHNPNSLQQCDAMLEEWGQHRQQVDECEVALRDSKHAQLGLRQQLMAALRKLRGPDKAIAQRPPEVARFQPTRKRSVPSSRSAVPAPSSAPIVQVLAPALGQHVITFGYTGRRGSQPSGSSGAEIYIALGEDAPVSDSQFRFAAWATRSPHLMQFSEKDAGQTAHYRLRWINAKGETGPWSEIVSAVIPEMAELA